jgi:hypothetical protein
VAIAFMMLVEEFMIRKDLRVAGVVGIPFLFISFVKYQKNSLQLSCPYIHWNIDIVGFQRPNVLCKKIVDMFVYIMINSRLIKARLLCSITVW